MTDKRKVWEKLLISAHDMNMQVTIDCYFTYEMQLNDWNILLSQTHQETHFSNFSLH